MAIVRSWRLISILLVLTACAPKPPPYTAHEISPPSSTSQSVQPGSATPRLSPTEASFVDEFDRPDTTFGLGDGWDLRYTPRGEVVLRPATDGYLMDGHFTYAGKNDVIAIRQFRAPVLAIGGLGQFSQRGNSGAETTIMIGTAGDANLTTDVIMFAASRTDWGIQSQKNPNGRLRTIATGQFARPLELGRIYSFFLSCTGAQVHILGPGLDVSRSLPLPITPGPLGFLREYPSRTPASGIFDFDKVWAIEEGLPATPLAAPAAITEH